MKKLILVFILAFGLGFSSASDKIIVDKKGSNMILNYKNKTTGVEFKINITIIEVFEKDKKSIFEGILYKKDMQNSCPIDGVIDYFFAEGSNELYLSIAGLKIDEHRCVTHQEFTLDKNGRFQDSVIDINAFAELLPIKNAP